MKIELQAYGKVNLGLDVLRRRPDGYHEVKMIMQTVKLHDTLTFETVDEDVIVLSTNADEHPGISSEGASGCSRYGRRKR